MVRRLVSTCDVFMVDLCTGIILAYATLAALYHKRVTGEGQRVETSLLESTLAKLANIYFMAGKVPTGMGTRNPQSMPSQAFKTKDSYVVVVITPNHWPRFCETLGRPEWIDDPKLGDAVYWLEHYDETAGMIEEVTKTKTTEEWLERFSSHHVAAGRINTVETAFQDPGVQATGIVKTVNHPKAGRIKVLDKPWRLSAAPDGLRLPPPPLGYHPSEVLLEAGYASGEIEALKQTGASSGD